MIDYRSFLGKTETRVLAWLSGPYVHTADRRLRLALPSGGRAEVAGSADAALSPGFYRFEIRGRTAYLLAPAEEAPDMSDLPLVRGHIVGERVVTSPPRDARATFASALTARARIVSLIGDETPAPLSLCRARVWHSGQLVFETLDFDGEAEEGARLALERGEGLRAVRGVPATLRAAFGLATGLRAARAADVVVSSAELAAHLPALADEGAPAARALLLRLEEQRAVARARADEQRAFALARAHATQAAALAHAPVPARARRLRTRGRGRDAELADAEARAEEALDAAGARMLGARRVRAQQLEVAFELDDERFVCVAHASTLQIIDSGICLSGEDDLVTIDSLPGVIREAMRTGRLVITRR